MMIVKCGQKENYFYLFGGKDESSYALIQGLTLAGVLFDEVALMPKSFVDQAIARTLSFKNAKIWFNCNPESPNHWFYKEWLTNPDKKYKHLHFLMKDNPILGKEEIERAEKLFSGVFYERYILGKWVRAEGIVFPEFANNPDNWIISKDKLPDRFRECYAGFDIGGNNSAYAMTCTALGYDGNYYVLKSTKKQAVELPMEDVERFAFDFLDNVRNEYGLAVEEVNTDHVDVIINTLNEKRYLFGKTYKPPLEDRPFAISMLLAQGRIKFVENECDDLVDELQNLVYDDKSEKAIVQDNGEMQIDTWDSFIYSLVGNWKYLIEVIK
jgi:PBSX family phage terminase large subunit